MKLSELKKGDKVRVSPAYKIITGIDIPFQTIERINNSFFWTEHIKAGMLKYLSHVVIDGKDIELGDDIYNVDGNPQKDLFNPFKPEAK